MQIANTVHCSNAKNRFKGYMATLGIMIVFFAISTHLFAQQNVPVSPSSKRVTGTVVDNSGEAIIGVSVKGYNTGTVTDLQGNFSLDIPADKTTLTFSYLGYKTQEVSFAQKNDIKIILLEDNVNLEEVVVVGYGVQKKTTVTGAISSVQTKELLQSPQANISNALVGRLSGLTAVQRSGEPGEDQATIRIRGIGSFAGSQEPLVMVDGIETPNYNAIDPNEIEDVTILKDASSTAVYGVRGANGVVLITTRRGTVSKPKVSASANYAAQNFTNLRNSMNSYDWARSFNEAISYDGYITGNYTPRFSEEELQKYKNHTDPIFYPDTDWIGLLFKDYTHQSQFNVNIRGGTEKVKYFTSLGYFTQDGLYNDVNTNILEGYNTQVNYNRYNIRANFDFQITKALSAVLNFSDQIINRKGPSDDTPYVLSNTFAHPPNSGPGVIDGKIINNLPNRYNFIPNPIWGLVVGHGHVKRYQNQLNTSTRMNLKLNTITEGLAAHATISYQAYNTHTIRYVKDVVTYDARETSEGPAFIPRGSNGSFGVNSTYGKNRKIEMEAGFDYARKFGDHDVTGLLLYNQSKRYDPGLAFVIPNGYQGIVGRVTYSFRNRYLAEFNAGWNGTENFAEGKRFGFFPAYSLGWIVTEEKFFPKTDIITFLKIRGSYGEVGNDRIGGDRFLYLPTAYTYGGGETMERPQWHFGQVGTNFTFYRSSTEGKIGNPDLTWERSRKMNIGADVNFWNDKIRLTFEFFQENRDNILTNKNTIPAIVGANMPAYNMGKMKNGGFDGEINFRDKIQNFNYWLKGVYTFAHNEIVYMDEVNQPYPYLQRTGHRYNQYFGFIAEGFFNTWEEVNNPNRPVYDYQNNKIQPGDVKYKDVNGDGVINSFDMVPIGYSDFPEVSYGLSFGGEWKGLDFSVLFQGSNNVSFRASKKSNRGFQEDGSAVDYLKDYSWTWERYANGEEIRFPHLSSSASQANNYQASTLWIRDASYVRLKNAEIGYSFKGKLIKKLGLSYARLYANGNNLFTWHNLFPGEDPEIPTYNDGNYEPYPIVRTFNIGLNLNF